MLPRDGDDPALAARSCLRCRRTRRTSRGARPACSRSARRCSATCRGTARRLRSVTTQSWEAFVERMTATGVAKDYTSFWWDVRPHPQLRDARDPDAGPADVARAHGRARPAAARALRVGARRAAACVRSERARRLRSRTAGQRRGSARTATLIHPDRDEALPVAELAQELPVPLDGLDPSSV